MYRLTLQVLHIYITVLTSGASSAWLRRALYSDRNTLSLLKLGVVEIVIIVKTDYFDPHGQHRAYWPEAEDLTSCQIDINGSDLAYKYFINLYSRTH